MLNLCSVIPMAHFWDLREFGVDFMSKFMPKLAENLGLPHEPISHYCTLEAQQMT